MKRILLMLLIGCLLAPSALAKTGKVKLDKQLVYEGVVEKKTPCGQGTLTAVNSDKKSAPYCQISGVFNGFDQVVNPEVYFDGLKVISAKGTAKLSVSINPTAFTLDLSGTSFMYDNQKYVFTDTKLILEKGVKSKAWTYELVSNLPTWMEQYMADKEMLSSLKGRYSNGHSFVVEAKTEVPSDVSKLGYEVDGVVRFFTFAPKFGPTDTNMFFLSTPYDHCRYLYKQGRHALFDNKYDGFIGIEEGSWFGKLKLDDAENNRSVLINKGKVSDPEVLIIYFKGNGPDIDSWFEGTICDVDHAIAAGYRASDIKFLNGIFKKDGKEERWINSVSEMDLRKQLSDKNVESDLVNKVIDGDLSVDEAISTQTKRDDKKRLAKEAKQEFAKHWKGTEVLFHGVLTSTQDGNDVFGALFGIDGSYFEGEAAVYLNDSGEARFVLVATPSRKALSQGRGRALQVNGFCQDINKDVSGQWSIKGNKLYIGGNDCSITISPDFKTLTYEGMLGAKMKIKSTL